MPVVCLQCFEWSYWRRFRACSRPSCRLFQEECLVRASKILDGKTLAESVGQEGMAYLTARRSRSLCRRAAVLDSEPEVIGAKTRGPSMRKTRGPSMLDSEPEVIGAKRIKKVRCPHEDRDAALPVLPPQASVTATKRPHDIIEIAGDDPDPKQPKQPKQLLMHLCPKAHPGTRPALPSPSSPAAAPTTSTAGIVEEVEDSQAALADPYQSFEQDEQGNKLRERTL